MIGMKLSERNGDVVGAVQVFEGDEVILISDQGTLVRIPADEVSTLGRNTQGVRLINLSKDEHLVGMAQVEEPEPSADEEPSAGEEPSAEDGEPSAGEEPSADD